MPSNSFEEYSRALAYLARFSRKKNGKAFKDPQANLRKFAEFLRLLGDPQKEFKYIHITGTAGKGTVASMLAQMLNQSGKKTGLFTSPHVSAEIERIKIGQFYIAPQDFAKTVEKLKPAIERMGREFPMFGLYFAIALLYFQEQNCEWVVLEAGLGGRFDATNIIDRAEVAAITNVGYDHMDLLGDTLEKIARDKAGIIKKETAFFTTEQDPAILKVFEQEAAHKAAKVNVLSLEAGQDPNAKLAKSIALFLNLPQKAIADGLKVKLPGRFELMQENPKVIVDGAHNRSKIKHTFDLVKNLSYQRLILVFATPYRGDYAEMIKPIKADLVFLPRITGARFKYLKPEQIKGLFSGSEVAIFEDPKQAISAAISKASPDDLVLITGSFVLSAITREQWYPKEWVLEHRKSFNQD